LQFPILQCGCEAGELNNGGRTMSKAHIGGKGHFLNIINDIALP